MNKVRLIRTDTDAEIAADVIMRSNTIIKAVPVGTNIPVTLTKKDANKKGWFVGHVGSIEFQTKG